MLQDGRLNTEIGYTFLNLGYRLLPVAGADSSYYGPTLPGVECTLYVRLNGPFSADAWFEAFRAGHAYVTNGRFLEFSVNGRPMGHELRVTRGAPLAIEASAPLNPARCRSGAPSGAPSGSTARRATNTPSRRVFGSVSLALGATRGSTTGGGPDRTRRRPATD